ncbi:hypothetical protein C3K47_04865 [Solitalea longa]|uniref:Thioredoxin domain-containing protein n=1 Tax=Solitalea longa TaxID=2079460 RepID=A0A2S5A5P5_9SPHI|nr:TlpA disulfide reductase family protein [Solitalea longa]POY37865.1 hypothetical protein C3K47_04865 [Solitalea longa]
MKKFILLLALILPFITFAQDSVTVSGKIKNFEKYLKENNSIQFYVNDIVLDDQLVYNAIIKPDGTFSLSFPKDQPQRILVRYLDGFSLIVSPGDKVYVSIDADNLSNSLKFSGDGAETNNILTSYMAKLNFKNSNRWAVLNGYQSDSSAASFKKYRYNLLEEESAFLHQFLKENKTTELFNCWAKHQLQYNCADDLMRYRWLHKPNISPKSDYFDFFERFSLNDPEASICSDYGSYIHEYSMYTSQLLRDQKKNNEPPQLSDLIDRVLTNDKSITEEEKVVLLKLKTQNNTPSTLNIGDTLIIKRVFEKNLGLLPVSSDLTHYASLCKCYFRDILLSNYTYHLIKSKYSDKIAYQIDLFQKLVCDDKIKQKILAEYKTGLDKLNNFKIPSQANLNTISLATPSDNIFEKLIEKYRGKVIYVDFWATWCRPCRDEMPDSKKLHEELRGKDVVFLYLGGRSEETTWKSVIAELGIHGEHFLLNNNEYNALAAKFQIAGIPHYVLVDKQGRVRDDKAKRPSDPALKTDILALLNENL